MIKIVDFSVLLLITAKTCSNTMNFFGIQGLSDTMKKPFKNRFRRWINRRIPRSDLQTFSQKNIFILPPGAGLVFGLLLVIMLLTGINYQNSLIYLSTFLLGAVFVGAMHQTHRNLSGLELTLIQPGEGFAGDDIPFRLRLKAGRDDAIAILLSCEESGLAPVHVHSGEAQDVTLPVHSAHRGYLRPDRVRIETRFPFGLLKAWSWLRPVSAGVVFPRPIAAPDAFSTVADGDESAEARSVEGNDHADNGRGGRAISASGCSGNDSHEPGKWWSPTGRANRAVPTGWILTPTPEQTMNCG